MTNTPIKGIAPMTMELTFAGTTEELISIAEYQLSPESLDSRDLGDAMGFFLTACMMEGGEWSGSMPGCDHLVQCTIDFDLFKWEGI